MIQQKWKILLILENSSAHHVSPRAEFCHFDVSPSKRNRQALTVGNFEERHHGCVIERRLMMTIGHPSAQGPFLKISLVNAVEMLKASWMEIRTGSIKNYFQKTEILFSPAEA